VPAGQNGEQVAPDLPTNIKLLTPVSRALHSKS